MFMFFGGSDPAAVMEVTEDLKAGLEGGSLTPCPIGQVSHWG
jgi:hypothetical protein